MDKKLIFIIMCLAVFSFARASEKIDINSATLSQLDELDGVGPAYAQRIIDSRPYSSVDDLVRVKGIGEKTLQKIKEQGLACVNCNSDSSIVAAEAATPTPAETKSGTTCQSGVYINEIVPSPDGSDEQNEWFEIYNSGPAAISLYGWKAEDKEGSKTLFSFAQDSVVQGNGYGVFYRPETKITLNNSGDGLSLLCPNGTVADSVDFGSAQKGKSYSKSALGWQWSTSPTPGSANKITAPVAVKTASKGLPKNEKSVNNNKMRPAETTAALNQEINTSNPWFLFFAASAFAIISAAAVLIIRYKTNTNVRT